MIFTPDISPVKKVILEIAKSMKNSREGLHWKRTMLVFLARAEYKVKKYESERQKKVGEAVQGHWLQIDFNKQKMISRKNQTWGRKKYCNENKMDVAL